MNENPQSVAKQIAEVNQPLPGLDRVVTPNRYGRLKKAGKAAGIGALGTATLLLGGMDMKDELNQPADQVSFTEAPRQVNPSQISTHETSPSTTMVQIGDGEGPYQVTQRMVEDGVIAPENAAATQHKIHVQYDQAPGGVKNPGDHVSVQVGGSR